MAQVINTNIASLNAQRNLNSSQAGTNQALERLSSGLRINSAKDDAAGLAISTRFESQIKGLNVAIRNAGDGVSLAQTAEGSLGSMTESLQRIRELALQASNGTNSSADRDALNAEAQLLIEEVTRVSEGANFNGVNLLDGSLSTSFQVGANAGESISVSIGKLTADTLGVSDKSGISSTSTSSALSGGDLVINGIAVGASRASDDSSSTSNASASAISKAAAINRVSADSGVTALVDENVAAGSEMTAAALAGSISINGTEISIETTTDADSSRSAVVTAINAQSTLTGVTAIDTGDSALGVSLVAEDGRNIELDLSTSGALTAASTGLAASGTYTGGVTLVADSGTNKIAISGSNTAAAGLASGTYNAGVANVSSTAQVAGPGTAAEAGAVEGTSTANVAFDYSSGVQAELATLNGGVQLSATGTDFSVASAAAATATTGVDLAVFANDFTNNGVAAEIAGTVDISATGTDFSGANDVAFTLSVVDGANYDVTIDQNYTDATVGLGVGSGNTALLADINGQIAGSGFTASLTDGTKLTFTQDTAAEETVIFTAGFASTDADTVFGFTAANDTDAGTADTATGSFDLEIDGLGTQTINLNSNIANSAALLAAIDAEINADFGGAVATSSLDGDGNLVITSATTGATSLATVSNAQGSVAGGAILGLQNATDSGTAALDISFNIVTTDGGTDTVTLNSSYLDADNGGNLGDGNTQLLADINTAIAGSGFTATLNVDNELVFTEDANGGDTITFNDNAGSVNAAAALGLGEGSTDTGVVAVNPTNATFDVYVNGGTVQSINVDNNVASEADLLNEINGQLTGGAASINDDGELVITSNTTGDSSSITIANLGGNAAAELGLVAGSDSGVDAGAAGFANLQAGDMVINSINIGAAKATDDTSSYAGSASSSKEASGISIAAAINRSTESTGVTATVNATTTAGSTAATSGVAGNTATLYLNGVDVGLTVQADADSNRAFAVNQINAATGQTGVVAEDNGTSVTLTAADGRNVSLAMNTNGGASAANFGLGGVGESDFGSGAVDLAAADAVASTTYSTVTLSSAGTIELSGGTNGNDDLAALGFQKGDFGGAVAGQFLNEVDISTQKGAVEALSAIDNALNSVNSARADLGAVQNRFEATISNLAINSENLSAANSRIRDADFAAEAANLARSQVLQQAGISILSQANASGQQVLSLLQ